jgi:chitin synthase
MTGDYFRDTNVRYNNTSNPNLRLPAAHNQGSQYGGQPPMSQYGMPQLPFMPFAGGPGLVAGSDYGGQMAMPQLP